MKLYLSQVRKLLFFLQESKDGFSFFLGCDKIQQNKKFDRENFYV